MISCLPVAWTEVTFPQKFARALGRGFLLGSEFSIQTAFCSKASGRLNSCQYLDSTLGPKCCDPFREQGASEEDWEPSVGLLSPWSSITPGYSQTMTLVFSSMLWVELFEQRCVAVASSLIRFTQVNGLQHLETGNCQSLGVASHSLSAILFWHSSFFPTCFGKFKPHKLFWGGTVLAYCMPWLHGLWFLCPRVFINWKVAQSFPVCVIPRYISCQHFKHWGLAGTPCFLKCQP